jgi:NAD(P)-dependent dehydrogenase (short-subunit alcohol dehydrogenase family)
LVNNAGIYIGKPFTTHTAEDFAAVVNVNMAGFYYITQLAIAEMEKHSSGHVVSVTSSAVDAAISGVYSVLAALTKGGLNAATKSLAIAYAKKGIRVNSFAQGIIKTPMHAPETHEALGAFHPLGRMGEMSDIADAILFLDSAPFITGEILHVDGGQSAGH